MPKLQLVFLCLNLSQGAGKVRSRESEGPRMKAGVVDESQEEAARSGVPQMAKITQLLQFFPQFDGDVPRSAGHGDVAIAATG